MKRALGNLLFALLVSATTSGCSKSDVRPSQGIGRTYSEVMAGISDFPMRRVDAHNQETFRRGIKDGARLEVIGGDGTEPVQSVMLAIAINPDDPVALDENTALFLKVLDNCLPDWGERSEWAYGALEKLRKDPNLVVVVNHKGRKLVVSRVEDARMILLGIGGVE